MPVPDTMVRAFAATAHRRGDRPALHAWAGGQEVVTTWSEQRRRVRHLALGLSELGIGAGDRVALVAADGPAWCAAEVAVMATGAAAVALPPDHPRPELARRLATAGVRVALVGDDAVTALVDDVGDGRVELAIRMPGLADGVEPGPGGGPTGATGNGIRDLEAVEAAGAAVDGAHPDRFEDLVASLDPSAPATVVVEDDDAVVLGHDHVLWALRALARLVGPTDERALVQSPCRRLLDRLTGPWWALTVGAELWFPSGDLASDLARARPTTMVAGPELWAELAGLLPDRSRGRRPMPAAAMLALGRAREAGESLSRSQRARLAALERTVTRRLHRRLGLDRCRVLLSVGSTPPRIVRDLRAAGLPVGTAWGVTTTAGLTTADEQGTGEPGSVGRPLPGLVLRVADDGQVLVRGDQVAMTATDGGRWLATGARGEVSADGELRLHGDGSAAAMGPARVGVGPGR